MYSNETLILEKAPRKHTKESFINESGITLIALVVTIVVLLILAGITVNLLFSDTGIFQKAQESEDAHKIGALKDQISTIILDWEVEKKIPNTTGDETIGTLEGLWNKFVEADIIDSLEEDVEQAGENLYEITTNEGYVVEIIVKEDGTVEIGDIVKGDNLPPRIGEITSSGTSSSIHVEVSITRSEGKVNLSYYYKKDGEPEENYIPLKENVADLTADFTRLEQGVIYNIKVVVTDDNGSTEKVVNQLTGELAEGTISQVGETQWSNGTATIQLETSQTGVNIVYQIGNIDGEWLPYPEEGISGLHHGDMVYAAISDGSNVSKESSFEIEDEIAPQAATIAPSTTSTEVGIAITATVTHVDNESGVNITSSKWVYNTTAGNIGTDENLYIGGTFSQNPQTISLNASTEGTYYLHVLTVDQAGNARETISSAITVKTPIISDGSFSKEKGVNTPDLADGLLTPIKWNGSSWVETTADDDSWYNYSTSSKQWANAKTEDGSMWVWIPRYAYQISSNYHTNSSSGGTINIKFMQGTSNTAADGTTSWNNSSGSGNWNIHPAFEYNGTKAGIWVAKFEASRSDATSSSTGSSNTLKIQPGVRGWSTVGVNEIFTICQNYNSSLNSHMMKNSEWGAVAYLSRSSYGMNGEIWINNSSRLITGSAGNSVSAESNVGTTNDYTGTQGVKASTTGTIYGIYDMSGGNWEYVAAYVNNGHGNLNTYASNLVNAASYMTDVYSSATSSGSDTQSQDYESAKSHYGDAVYETSANGEDAGASWYSDYSYFPSTSGPIFLRGGSYRHGANAGIFHFTGEDGTSIGETSFRPVLIAP